MLSPEDVAFFKIKKGGGAFIRGRFSAYTLEKNKKTKTKNKKLWQNDKIRSPNLEILRILTDITIVPG